MKWRNGKWSCLVLACLGQECVGVSPLTFPRPAHAVFPPPLVARWPFVDLLPCPIRIGLVAMSMQSAGGLGMATNGPAPPAKKKSCTLLMDGAVQVRSPFSRKSGACEARSTQWRAQKEFPLVGGERGSLLKTEERSPPPDPHARGPLWQASRLSLHLLRCGRARVADVRPV